MDQDVTMVFHAFAVAKEAFKWVVLVFFVNFSFHATEVAVVGALRGALVCGIHSPVSAPNLQ
jgi:hypothetical protein